LVRSVTELKNNNIREAAGDALEAIAGLVGDDRHDPGQRKSFQ
jgi:hypothetical protein